MKLIYSLPFLILLSACAENKCKTCKTEIKTQGYPNGQMKISLNELGITAIPMTIESEDFFRLGPMTLTFEACGKELKRIEGKEITIQSGDFNILLKTTCKKE